MNWLLIRLTRQKNISFLIFLPHNQRITGKSYCYSRLLLIEIKEQLNKEEHQFVSIEEFCLYTGLKLELVNPLIVG